jgi:hypothetical protein
MCVVSRAGGGLLFVCAVLWLVISFKRFGWLTFLFVGTVLDSSLDNFRKGRRMNTGGGGGFDNEKKQ